MSDVYDIPEFLRKRPPFVREPKDRPILFSGSMVRAIREDRKGQTRRVIKPQPYIDDMGNACWKGWNFGQSADHVPHFQRLASSTPGSKTKRVYCPYGAIGDRLWVRESCRGEELDSGLDGVRYRADDEFIPIQNTSSASIDWLKLHTYRGHHGAPAGPWVPAIHMPRWASRLLLEVTDVRVERLNDISESDALAEGITEGTGDFAGCFTCGPAMSGTTANECYERLWESINGPGSWAANPWVWVVEFRRVMP